MNVDVYMQDFKGITEYSKEEREEEQLKKQIKVAESSLEMVIKKNKSSTKMIGKNL